VSGRLRVAAAAELEVLRAAAAPGPADPPEAAVQAVAAARAAEAPAAEPEAEEGAEAEAAAVAETNAWKARLTSGAARRMLQMESELDVPPEVRNRVKELRLERGWTQQELADAVGVSRQSINSIERDRYVPSLALALLFARVFDCPTDGIFTLEDG
jgi:putative transcriptional regulator